VDHRHRLREPLRDLAHLALALDVDAPAGELHCEPHVLALAADRERELVVGDDHVHRLLALVDDHLGDLGGRERAAHVARRIGAPRHDVDALAAQLLHDGLHAAALHADARADRVDVVVARRDRDLRTHAGLARGGLYRDDALVDLGNLGLEELVQQLDRRARQDDLRALRLAVHVDHVGADAVAGPIALARRLLLGGQHRFRAAEVDDQRALLEAADDAVHDLALAVLVLVEDDAALCLADALDDHLLRDLREDAAEVLAHELDPDLVAALDLGIELARLRDQQLRVGIGDHLDDGAELEELDLARLVVEARLHLLCGTEALVRRLQHRLFERTDDHLAIDALVFGDLIDLTLEGDHRRASSAFFLAKSAFVKW